MLGIINSGMSLQDMFINIITMLGAMVLAFGIHEYAHGLVAYWNGDNTAKINGRLTMNPLKHLDLIGTLSLLLVGFGWAKPVPINTNNFTKQTRGLFTVSIAGVTANLILAIINFAFLLILAAIVGALKISVDATFAVIAIELFESFFLYGIVINLTLMAFNLLPIYPLDGFHIVESFTRYDNKFCVFMRKYGHIALLGLIIFGAVMNQIAYYVGGQAGMIIQYFDIIGSYISLITDSVMSLFNLIASAIL